MTLHKRTVGGAALLAALVGIILLAGLGSLQAQAEGAAPGRAALARVVLLTTTKGCECTLKRCRAGEAVVAQIFSGPRGRLVSRVDLATAKDADAYTKNYHVMVAPALLLLDAQGRLLWSAQGELSPAEIERKLQALGG